jgi:hypothetical protein
MGSREMHNENNEEVAQMGKVLMWNIHIHVLKVSLNSIIWNMLEVIARCVCLTN